MDINDLTKTQIVLLMILVSFVSSIAVGITIVRLLDQEPKPVTSTINRVIQRTIERVTPGESSSEVRTIVVKEQDLIVDAIEKNSKAFVTLTSGDKTITGFFVSSGGLLVSNSVGVNEKSSYEGEINGSKFKASVVAIDPLGFAILKAEVPTEITSIPLASSGLRVGDTLITLAGIPPTTSISTVSGTGELKKEEGGIKTFIPSAPLSQYFIGSPVLNLDGELSGIVIPKGEEAVIVSSNVLKSFLK